MNWIFDILIVEMVVHIKHLCLMVCICLSFNIVCIDLLFFIICLRHVVLDTISFSIDLTLLLWMFAINSYSSFIEVVLAYCTFHVSKFTDM